MYFRFQVKFEAVDAYKRWHQQLNVASTPEQKRALYDLKPQVEVFCDRLKAQLKGEGAHAWTLKHHAFLLEHDPRIQLEDEEILLDWVERTHLKSPGAGKFCLALIAHRPNKTKLQMRKIALADKISTQNPSREDQGLAALAHSIALGVMGEGDEIVAKRLELVRKAIVHAANEVIGDKKASDYAQAEVFQITKLTLGRQAPGLSGKDVAGDPIALSDYRGRVVMLVFWSQSAKNNQEVLEFCRGVVARRQGQNMILLGVNNDLVDDLATLKIENQVTWRNFSDPQGALFGQYHITQIPYCMILDAEGKILYKGLPGAFADFALQSALEEQ